MQTYGQEVAEAIIGNYCDDLVEINEKGVWTKRKDLEILQWRPVCELDGPDSPDPFTTPGLPIPFNVNELAAFMINGPGAMVSSAYGDWQDGPYDEILQTMGILATKAKEALRGAYAAYRDAERVVGHRNLKIQKMTEKLADEYDQANLEANAREKLWEPGISPQEATKRRARAKDSIAKLESKLHNSQLRFTLENDKWVKAIVNHLLKSSDLANHNKSLRTAGTRTGNGEEPFWKNQARIKAKEIIKRQATRDLYPNMIEIADEIASIFRETDVFGDSGKPLTGATIKRHALKGINSAKNKSKSTSKGRGKQGK